MCLERLAAGPLVRAAAFGMQGAVKPAADDKGSSMSGGGFLCGLEPRLNVGVGFVLIEPQRYWGPAGPTGSALKFPDPRLEGHFPRPASSVAIRASSSTVSMDLRWPSRTLLRAMASSAEMSPADMAATTRP